MISTNELRIGNLILWNPKLRNPDITLSAMPVEVSSILSDKIGYTSPNFEHRVEPFEDDRQQNEAIYKPLEELEPIKLTTDLVAKAEFINNKKTKFVNQDFELNYDIKAGHFFYKQTNKSYIVVHHLHQLQNLYFALTEKELFVSL